VDTGTSDGECSAAESGNLFELLSRKVVGQPAALQRIVPYIQMYHTRLNPPDRPAGIFMLLGPTGTGKTRTVEALAEILHGSSKHLLKIDCAEFQSDHEVAKLIGAPPGYIGHRESKPMLTQERLLASVSPRCDLALVLFDEIEKAAPAFTALLLGILDRATLRLGDNTPVNFEKTLIFLTSNLGARDMVNAVGHDIGFRGARRRSPELTADLLHTMGFNAVRKRFSPEFVNRIDVVVTYQALDAAAIGEILDHHIAELQQHVRSRLGSRSFDITVSPSAREFLLTHGISNEFGARELKRVVHRMLTQPLAALVADGDVMPGSLVRVEVAEGGRALHLRSETAAPMAGVVAPVRPLVLAVDENAHLLKRLEQSLAEAGMSALIAATSQEAREIAARQRPDLAIVDLVLPDGDGLSVARELQRTYPGLRVVMTTGTELSSEESEVCERQEFPVLRKPYLPEEVVNLVRDLGLRSAAASG
jgi:CheY-like chemotaxis protein